MLDTLEHWDHRPPRTWLLGCDLTDAQIAALAPSPDEWRPDIALWCSGTDGSLMVKCRDGRYAFGLRLSGVAPGLVAQRFERLKAAVYAQTRQT